MYKLPSNITDKAFYVLYKLLTLLYRLTHCKDLCTPLHATCKLSIMFLLAKQYTYMPYCKREYTSEKYNFILHESGKKARRLYIMPLMLFNLEIKKSTCSLKFRCSSIYIPRNLTLFTLLIEMPSICIA